MNKGPTLATLVKKWLKNYSCKSQWSFSYYSKEPGNLAPQFADTSRGWLEHNSQLCSDILIEEDYAILGSHVLGPKHSEGKIKIIPADPRFFSKLDKMMQFATRKPKRWSEAIEAFEKAEISRLKEILG